MVPGRIPRIPNFGALWPWQCLQAQTDLGRRMRSVSVKNMMGEFQTSAFKFSVHEFHMPVLVPHISITMC